MGSSADQVLIKFSDKNIAKKEANDLPEMVTTNRTLEASAQSCVTKVLAKLDLKIERVEKEKRKISMFVLIGSVVVLPSIFITL